MREGAKMTLQQSMWKRVLTVLLAVVTATSMMPVSALAGTYTSGSGQEQAQVAGEDAADEAGVLGSYAPEGEGTAEGVSEGGAGDAAATQGEAATVETGAAAAQATQTAEAQAAEDPEAGTAAEDEAILQEEPEADPTYSGGSGTEDDPYQLANAQDMYTLSQTVLGGNAYIEVYFVLTADIDLSSVCREVDGSIANDVSWTPIGYKSSSSNTQFRGNFNGQGHKIENLYINASYVYNSDAPASSMDIWGLFGRVGAGATIENFTVSGSITGDLRNSNNGLCMGGVVAQVGGAKDNVATIRNVGSSVSLKSWNSWGSPMVAGCVGGIAGSTSFANIDGCWYDGSMDVDMVKAGSYDSPQAFVGGIAGQAESSSVQNCYSAGAIYDAVTASSNGLGGIVGRAYYNSSNKDYPHYVKNCYSTTKMSSKDNKLDSRMGGIVGTVIINGNTCADFENNYYLSTIASKDNATTTKALSDEEMRDPLFAGMLNSSMFGATSDGYPALLWENRSGAPTIVKQPTDIAYLVGASDAELKVEATPPAAGVGSKGALTYQWYSSDDAEGTNAQAIDGATKTALQVPVSKAGDFWYYCQITNTWDGGSFSLNSNIAKVYVGDTITAQPVVKTIDDVSTSYAFDVQLAAELENADDSGIGVLTYQWYSNTSNSTRGASAIANATSSTYKPDTKKTGQAWYYCVVTNTFGNAGSKQAVSNIACVDVSDTVKIATAEELAAFRDRVNAGAKHDGITVSLESDIDLSDICHPETSEGAGDAVNWMPIGSNNNMFFGVFEGNYHKITGLYIDNQSSGGYQGLFGYVCSSSKRAKLLDFTVWGTVSSADYSYTGGVAGCIDGGYSLPVEVVNVGNYVDVSGYEYTGGIVGYAGYAYIDGCFNAGTVKGKGSNTGGIVGLYESGCSVTYGITNCSNHEVITADDSSEECYGVGGIAGAISDATQATGSFSNNYNAGNIVCSDLKYNPGGVVGTPFSNETLVHNNYYLDSTCSRDGSKSSAVADTWLKSSSACIALGDAFVGVDGGYPVQTWRLPANGSPIITAQPQGGSVKVGETAVALTVEATLLSGMEFSKGTLSYQWYSNKADSNTGGAKVEGADKASYTVPTNEASAAYYYCVVTNTWGDGQTAFATSQTASYSVLSDTQAAAPTIKVQPAETASYDLLAKANPLTVEAEVAGEGAGTLSYQWYVSADGKNTGGVPIYGATEPSYTPSTSSPSEAGYYCVVTNAFEIVKTASTASNVATVKVSDTAYVASADDMWAIAEASQNGIAFERCTVALAANIDLGASAEKPWVPIDGFKGTFDGGFHTISGIYTTEGGLFNRVYGPATIRNFVLKGSITKDGTNIGAIANSSYGTVDGGRVTFQNIRNDASVTGRYNVAGILYQDQASTSACAVLIEGCANTGTITTTQTGNVIAAGIMVQSNSNDVRIVNCYNTGNLEGASGTTGQFFGITYYRANIVNCYNAGSVGNNSNASTICWDSTSLNKVSNTYYLGTTATTRIPSGATSKTADELMAAGMAAQLSGAYVDVEGFYPKLAWEVDPGVAIINAQPQGAVIVLGEGSAPTLSVEASLPAKGAIGYDGKLRYQWQKNTGTVEAPKWENITDATSNSYIDKAGAGVLGTTWYRCIVTNTYGDVKASTTSDEAAVYVLDSAAAAPVFTTQPASATFKMGASGASIAAAASFADGETAQKGEIAYQWYSCDDAKGANPVAIAGATSASYGPNTSERGVAYYYVEASNVLAGDVMSNTTKSDVATVTVEPSKVIKTAQDLADFAAEVNDGKTFAGETISLEADIDLSSVCGPSLGSWMPIGRYSPTPRRQFAGIFEGNGHKITNLYISADNGYKALFGYVASATLRNFIVDGTVNANGYKYAAGVVAYCRDNVAIQNVGSYVDIDGAAQYCGGIIGQLYYANQKGCSIDSCFNKGTISSDRATSTDAYFGGIVGYSNYSNATIVNCMNAGNIDVSGTNAIRGVAGIIGRDTKQLVMENCLNVGTITSTGQCAPMVYSWSSGTSTNNYALEGCCPDLYKTNFAYTMLTAGDMKTAASKLGAAYKDAGAYPLLTWDDGGGFPSIVSQNKPEKSYQQGETAEALTVEAALPREGLLGSNGKLSFTWYEASSYNVDAASDVPVTEGVTTGESNTSLVPDTSVSSTGGYHYYYCKVDNIFDGQTISVYSDVVRINITSDVEAAAPYIISQPTTTWYLKGDAANAIPLSVVVATDAQAGPGVGDITYQWYAAKTIESYQNATGTAIKGATQSTYTPYLDKVGTVYYYCVVTNTFENTKVETTKSNVVKARTWSVEAATPVIEQQPAQEASYHQGDEAEALSVKASKPSNVADLVGGMSDESASLSYQWYYNTTGTPDPANDTAISGAIEATYTPSTRINPDIYYYYCVVTNSFSTVYPASSRTSSIISSCCKQTLVSDTDPATPEVQIVGDSAKYSFGDVAAPLSVEVTNSDATGMGKLSYQWYSTTGTPDPSQDAALADGTEATYTPKTYGDVAGTHNYYCVVTNTFEHVKTTSATSGTVDVTIDPKLVKTAQELLDVSNAVAAGNAYEGITIQLANDIDLSAVCGEDLGNWKPIGNGTTQFKGVFDGAGHTISNLYYNGAEQYVGLFGRVMDATIKNLTVSGSINVSTTQASYIGGVVGYWHFTSNGSTSTSISNVCNEVSINVEVPSGWQAPYVGGVIGYTSNGNINAIKVGSVCNRADITVESAASTGAPKVGGIVSYAYAALEGSGLYNTGAITVNTWTSASYVSVGGIFGQYSIRNGAVHQVSACYNTGKVAVTGGRASTKKVGSIAGSGTAIEKAFYLEGTSDFGIGGVSEDPAGVVKKSDSEMKDAALVAQLGAGIFKEGSTYPIFLWEADQNTPVIVTQPESGGWCLQGDANIDPLTVEAKLPVGNKAPSLGSLSFKWYSNTTGKADPSTDKAVESGVTSTETTSSMVPSSANTGSVYYYCVVTDTYQGGSSQTTSDVASFSVLSSTKAATPEITAQPVGATYALGAETESLSVTAKVEGDGAGALSYQWYSCLDAEGSGATPIFEATNQAYKPAASSAGSMWYFCRVTNTFEGVKTAYANTAVVEVHVNGSLQVGNAEELAAVASAVASGQSFEGMDIELTGDIDLSAVCGEKLGSWTVIGTRDNPFKGGFTGNGHSVYGLYVKSVEECQGLFGYVDGSDIRDVTVYGSVETTGTNAAGVVGYAQSATISRVCNMAKVSGGMNTAGIVGTGVSATIASCANKGAVSGSANVSGIIGRTVKSASVTSCYNTGFVAATQFVAGGIVGNNEVAETKMLARLCYNTGKVESASGKDMGAIAGKGFSTLDSLGNAFLQDCCELGDATGAVEYSDSAMKGTDFATSMGSAYAAVEGAYPRLVWEKTAGAEPVIVSQPKSAAYPALAQADALEVSAMLPAAGEGAGGKLSYQWFRCTDGSGAGATSIDNAVESSYMPSTTEMGAFYYFCEATNTYAGGSAKAVTNVVLVTVYDHADAAAPTITAQPQAVKGELGDPALTMSVSATVDGVENGQLEYQWYRAEEGAASPDTDAKILGADDPVLTIPTGSMVNWDCYCVVTSVDGGKRASAVSDVANAEVTANFVIATSEDLQAFNDASQQSDFEGKTVVMTADVKFPSSTWTKSIANDGSIYFKGTFDGQGHTIYDYNGRCLFYRVGAGATIENLVIKSDVTVTDLNVVGTSTNSAFALANMIVGSESNRVSIRNIGCEVPFEVGVSGNSASGAGLAWDVSNADIEGCYNKGDQSTQTSAGLVCTARNCNFTNCYNTGKITSSKNPYATSDPDSGGLVGRVYNGAYFENCYNVGTVSSTTTTGGAILGIVGVGSTSEPYGTNNFYLDGSCARGDVLSTTVAKSETEMKSAAFAQTLGGAYRETEGGYPQLVWEGKSSLSGFEIEPIEAQTYTGEAITPAVVVSCGEGDAKQTLVEGKDYTLTLTNNVDAGTAKVVAKGISPREGKLFASFEISAKSLDGAAVSQIPTQYYTGQAVTPVPGITVDGRELVAGTDFEVVYKDMYNGVVIPVKAGKYVAVAMGIGNYSGELAPIEFEIATQTDVASLDISQPEGAVYDGTAHEPAVRVSDGDKALVAGVDYDLSYEGNVHAGTATVRVFGKGDYAGTVEKTFEIAKAGLAVKATDTRKKAGAAEPRLEASADGLAAGDELYGVLVLRESGEEVGTYAITPSRAVVMRGSELATNDYDVSYEDGVFTIAGWTRLAGEGRMQTMSAIVAEGFDSAETVILATAWNFPDALGASGLAGVLGAPVLLTDGDSLSDEAADQIERLGAKNVVIVGGESAVSANVASQLEDKGLDVARAAGEGRSDTALKVYEQGADSWGKTAIVTSGYGFADALSISPYAYATKSPVLLANGDGSIDANTMAVLKSGKFDQVIVVGGTAAVSADAAAQISASGGPAVMRLAGNDRYETSGKIADYAIQQGILSAEGMAVATGSNYPDALAGSALCGKKASVLVLVNDSNMQYASNIVEKVASTMSQGYVLGGTGAVSEDVKATLEGLLK